jgi:NAD(P)-dependent dehydrogenase (short-subunit alcohol dehydrogenase family)
MSALSGQVAVVTGAGSGIGRAIALALAREQATVALLGRTAGKLAAVAREASVDADRMICLPVDLDVDEAVQTVARTVALHCGRVDILVHCAAVFGMGRLEDTPPAEFDRLYRTNTRAPLVLTQALLPLLRQAQGQVVFVNSSAGLTAGAAWGAYSASKAALKMVADSLRAEVNAEGVRVLSVYPGRTAGPMQASVHQLEGKPYVADRLIQPEDIAAVVLNALRLPRTAEVTDLNIRPMAKPR